MDFLGPNATLSVRVDGAVYGIEQNVESSERRFLRSLVVVFKTNSLPDDLQQHRLV
jgi:hypothetical protein